MTRELKGRTVLDNELHELAEKADAFPKTIVHRDFQSQNIMITDGDIPRLIDFQGARIGPPGYDVVSMLWDPYYRLNEDLKTLLTCRLQRHMQALGAYGFLSSVKGKKYFLKHIPEGLQLLKEDSTQSQKEYPELYKLVNSL
jgi:aminoglycoside/choline kinase family phosphotransferase